MKSKFINYNQKIFDDLYNQCHRLLAKNIGVPIEKTMAQNIFLTSDIILTKDGDLPVTLIACRVNKGVPRFNFCLFGVDSSNSQEWFKQPTVISTAINAAMKKYQSPKLEIVVLTNSAMHTGLVKSLSTTYKIKQNNLSNNNTILTFTS